MSTASKPEIYFSFFMFTADLKPEDKYYTHVLVNHLNELTDMGYDGFDLHIADQPVSISHDREIESYRRLKEAFNLAGLEHLKFTTNVGTTRTFDPTSPDPRTREMALAYLKSRVDITWEMGGASIMSGPFLYPYGVFPQTASGEPLWSDALLDWMKPRYQAAQPIFKDLAEYAMKKGVKLAIEPVKSWETPPPNMVSEALDFVEDINSEFCGVTVDTAQAIMESQGPLKFKENVDRAVKQKRLHYVHISAPDRGALHDSWIPWEIMLDKIVPVYEGPYLVEVFNAIPPFASSMRMVRRRYWRPGDDGPESNLPSAYDIAQAGLVELSKQIDAAKSRALANPNT